jgi:hypothetical protein
MVSILNQETWKYSSDYSTCRTRLLYVALPTVGTGTAICSTRTYFYSSFPSYRSQELAALVSPQPPSTHIPGRSPVLTKKLNQMFVNTIHTALKLNFFQPRVKNSIFSGHPGKVKLKGPSYQMRFARKSCNGYNRAYWGRTILDVKKILVSLLIIRQVSEVVFAAPWKRLPILF